MENRVNDLLFGEFERVGKALGSRRRLDILDLLAQGERSVDELAREMSMPVANASQHLQVFKNARLVETRPEGTRVLYRISDDRVFLLWQALRSVASARLAEIEQITRDFLSDRAGLEPVEMHELLARLENEDVLVLDVRPREEYASGHIPGARSVPPAELEARLSELRTSASSLLPKTD